MTRTAVNHQFVIHISPRSVVISTAEPLSLLHRAEVDLPRETSEWITAIGELAEEIKPSLQGAVSKGARALILYQSPALVSQVSCLSIANRMQAEKAACLACAVTTHQGASHTVERAALIGTDSLNDETRSHLVAAADRTEVVEAVAAFALKLGFEVDAIVPTEMYTTSNMIRWALNAKSNLYGVLHIGRTYSCLAVSQDGVLHLFRQVGFVTQQLVDALVLPIVIDAESGRTVELNHEEAETLICRFGIPNRDEVIDEERGLRGFHILSAIQSHLQRAAVEIKQSIRFGLPEEMRTGLTLHLNGAGSRLPNLREALSDLLDVPLEEDCEHGCMGVISHSPIDDLECTLQHNRASSVDSEKRYQIADQLNLLPPSVRRRRFESRFRKGLWVGLAAGLFMVIGDAVLLHRQSEETSKVLSGLRAEKEQLATAHTQRDEVIVLNNAMTKVQGEIAEYGRDATAWPAVLEELSQASDEEIRLTGISADTTINNGKISPHLKIDGFAFGTSDGGQIHRYVDRLRRSPMFSDVVMGDVSPSQMEGKPMRHFHLDIMITPFDPEIIDTTVSLTSAEESGNGK